MDLQKNKKIAERILAGVDEQVRDLVRGVLQHYDGLPKALEEILNRTGKNNIYQAVQSLELFSVEYGEDVHTEKGKRRKKLATSATGQAISLAYLFRDKDNSATIVPFGYQSAPKIFQTFGTSAQAEMFIETEEKKKKQREHKEKAATETLEEIISMQDRELLGAKDRIGKISEEIIQAHQELYALVYGNTSSVLDPLQRVAVFVPLERGATFSWFKQHFDQLPDDVRNSLAYVNDKFILPSAVEYKQHMFNLMQYAMMHRYIDKDTVLGSYQQDFDLLLNLAKHNPEHDLIKTYGTPDLRAVTDIIAKPEITFIEAARVLQAYPVHRVRQEINEQYYQQYKGKTEELLDRLYPLFVDGGGKLQDDVYRSVPKRMTNDSLYALALLQPDFDAVRKHIILSKLGKDQEKTIQRGLAIEEYKQHIDDLVVAARKINIMDAITKKNNVLVEDPENARDIVQQYRHLIPVRGKGYALKENFERQSGISCEDFLDRLSFVYRHQKTISGAVYAAFENHTAGLYNRNVISKLEECVTHLKKYIPRSAFEDDITAAKKVTEHLLYAGTVSTISPVISNWGKYVLPETKKKFIDTPLDAINIMDNELAVYLEEQNDILHLSTELDKVKDACYVRHTTSDNIMKIEVHHEQAFHKLVGTEIRYIHPKSLCSWLEHEQKEYVSLASLNDEQREQLNELGDRNRREQLNKSGCSIIIGSGYYLVTRSISQPDKFSRGEKVYIPKSLLIDLQKIMV